MVYNFHQACSAPQDFLCGLCATPDTFCFLVNGSHLYIWPPCPGDNFTPIYIEKHVPRRNFGHLSKYPSKTYEVVISKGIPQDGKSPQCSYHHNQILTILTIPLSLEVFSLYLFPWENANSLFWDHPFPGFVRRKSRTVDNESHPRLIQTNPYGFFSHWIILCFFLRKMS